MVKVDPSTGDGFGWGMHAGLLRAALPATKHEWLRDEEIASDDEDGKELPETKT